MKLFLEFDAEVQRERVKAQDALKDIQNIKELINMANTQAGEVERALNGSEDNAKNAREIAQNAQVRQTLLRITYTHFVCMRRYTPVTIPSFVIKNALRLDLCVL